ncbi:MAG: DUF4097 family beta strand repeat protein [Bacilli bacterium]|nr:DUF4097 family beta strand repeat protein [Bacilli bacterium]
MKKTIIWIAITFCLLLVASVVLYSLSITVKLETNEYEIKETFENIKIITDTADIDFVLSENLNTLIICEEHKNIKHSVNVKENTLLVEVNDNRKWYEHIGISTSKITIYLSKNEYDEFIMESDTGNIRIKSINANKLDLSTLTGNLKIVNTKCKNLFSESDTGNILLENVIASEKFKIETDTGDVKFKDSDASDIFVKTDTGNVTGNLLTDKVIFAESDTGNIDVPKVITDEKCEIITDTGDIKITID